MWPQIWNALTGGRRRGPSRSSVRSARLIHTLADIQSYSWNERKTLVSTDTHSSPFRSVAAFVSTAEASPFADVQKSGRGLSAGRLTRWRQHRRMCMCVRVSNFLKDPSDICLLAHGGESKTTVAKWCPALRKPVFRWSNKQVKSSSTQRFSHPYHNRLVFIAKYYKYLFVFVMQPYSKHSFKPCFLIKKKKKKRQSTFLTVGIYKFDAAFLKFLYCLYIILHYSQHLLWFLPIG